MDHREAAADAKAARARAKALRPWYRKKRWWLLLVVVIIIGSTAAGVAKSGKGTITISVTGDLSAQTLVTVEVNGQEHQDTGTLPYTQAVQNSAFADVAVTAQTQDGSPSASITCTIDIPGKAPVTSTSMGAYTIVTCTGIG